MFDVAEHRRVDTSRDDVGMVRTAISSPAIIETFATAIGNKMVAAIHNEPDSTQGWVHETAAANFLPATLFTLEFGARLEPLPKGQPAKHTSFGTKGEPFGIARYAGQFVLEEQDMLNGSHVGAVFLAPAQHAAAAARLKSDLVYSILLDNPALSSDEVDLFHTTHANIASGGGSVLSATSLDTGIGAIGLQCLKAHTDSRPIHGNYQAQYLVVPPQLVGIANRLNYANGSTLTVRQESRLSALGVVDPNTLTVYAGTATNWLLAAKPGTQPSIVCGGLNGPPTPSVRQFTLDQGQWGIGWDILCDIGAAAVDYRTVYWSAGA